MSIPRLNLAEYSCDALDVELITYLKAKAFKTMLETEVFENFLESGPNIFAQNYRIGETKNSLCCIVDRRKAENKQDVILASRFIFRPEWCSIAPKPQFKLRIPKFFGFLNRHMDESRMRTLAIHAFSLEEFESIVKLPYAKKDMSIEKSFEICGLEFSIKSEEGSYNQILSVSGDLLYQYISVPASYQKLEQSCFEDTLRRTFGYAEELMRKRDTSAVKEE
ncbi:MAG: hypothetical protein ABIK83_15965 [Candidatus Zixiibacteriota bacterium]